MNDDFADALSYATKLLEKTNKMRWVSKDEMHTMYGSKKITISRSCTNPEYAVEVYPDHEFGLKGAGWHMFRTDEPEHALSPAEVEVLAGKEVVDELVGLGNFLAWG